MKKKKNKGIIITLILVIGIIGIIYSYNRNNNKKPVFVYNFADGLIGLTDYYETNQSTGGNVVSDNVQTVVISSTQTILDIFVEEGQTVAKGDKLLAYDTSLSDLNLKQKAIEIEQIKLNLNTAKKDLENINKLKPSEKPETTFDPLSVLVNYDLKDKEYLAYYGDGHDIFNPMYVWLRSDGILDQKFLEERFEYLLDEDLPSGEKAQNEVYLKVHNTVEDKNNSAVINEYGVKISRKINEDKTDQNLGYSFYDLNLADGNIDMQESYTNEEIATMKKEKIKEINNLEFKVKVAQTEYNIMCKEADSGILYAEVDGVVRNLKTVEEAKSQNIPLMKVTAGGGYYINSYVSELALDKVKVGQKVLVNSWQSGNTYTGEVVSISHFPASDYYNDPNANVSYYPYKIVISETANLQDFEYVSVTLQDENNSEGLYLDNAFYRSDGVSNYVYLRNEEGKLEKRKIKIGKNLWGSYTEILSGITAEDWIAFPYGNNVKEGALTSEGTADNLYNGGANYGKY